MAALYSRELLLCLCRVCSTQLWLWTVRLLSFSTSSSPRKHHACENSSETFRQSFTGTSHLVTEVQAGPQARPVLIPPISHSEHELNCVSRLLAVEE